jgi:hypothetical protein
VSPDFETFTYASGGFHMSTWRLRIGSSSASLAVKLSSLLHFIDDDIVVGIVNTCVEDFSLHFADNDLHPNLCR